MLELLNGGEGVLLDGGVVFDEDELRVFAFGEVGEGLGGWIGGIAVCGDDDLGGLRGLFFSCGFPAMAGLLNG